AACRRVRGQDFQRRQGCRSASRAAGAISSGDQPQDRRCTRRDDPGGALRLRRRGDRMKRRDVITLLGGAAATPILATLAARAQQAMPLVGILSAGPAEASVDRMRALRLGLKDAGYVEGVAFEYRWAENQI